MVRWSVSCSWCHALNRVGDPLNRYCSECEHRADVPQAFCDCGRCLRWAAPADAAGMPVVEGAAVQFVEPYQGFAGGRVVQLLHGVMGAIAGVEVEPGRTVDTLCRKLRVVRAGA